MAEHIKASKGHTKNNKYLKNINGCPGLYIYDGPKYDDMSARVEQAKKNIIAGKVRENHINNLNSKK